MIDTITETFDELEYLFAEIVKIEITQSKTNTRKYQFESSFLSL